jgi:glycosyltransferase involved in cell wall biosynthesis
MGGETYRILLQGRTNLFSKLGGDSSQLFQLQRELNALGHKAKISVELNPNLEEVDLVHCLNLNRLQETYLQVQNARTQGVKVVLSPVFHNLTSYYRKGRFGIAGGLSTFLSYEALEQARNAFLWLSKECPAKACSQVWSHGYFGCAAKILDTVDGLICNTLKEKHEVQYFFSPRQMPATKIISPGINPDELDPVDECFTNRYRLRNYVLCVARIEDLKNQLRIISALAHLSIPLVFIGYPNPHHRSYLARFKREVARLPQVFWFPKLSRKETLSALKTAQVHVLASMVETTGLANLEAGYFGANLVSTENGYAREIFKGFVNYCDPGDEGSIRDAILKAFHSPYSPKLKPYILKHYNEKLSVLKHLDFYGRILHTKNSSCQIISIGE